LRRCAQLSGALGPGNRALCDNWSWYYDAPHSEQEAEFAQLRRTAVDVTSVEAARFRRDKWWRTKRKWWRKTSKVIVEHLPANFQEAVDRFRQWAGHR